MGHGYRVPRRPTRQEKCAALSQVEQTEDWWREMEWFAQRLRWARENVALERRALRRAEEHLAELEAMRWPWTDSTHLERSDPWLYGD